MKLTDKVVVITGGSSGLGKEMAKLFKAEDAIVIINSYDKKKLELASKELGVDSFPADVCDEAAMNALADYVVKKYKKIDIWVNNAGIWAAHSAIEDLNIARVKEMLEVNTLGTIIGVKVALRRMKPFKQGTIMNIISTSGLAGRPNSAGYCASKWGVRGFTQSLIMDSESTGIHIIGVYPHQFKSEIFQDKKPVSFAEFMEAEVVAKQVIENLKKENPNQELVIRE